MRLESTFNYFGKEGRHSNPGVMCYQDTLKHSKRLIPAKKMHAKNMTLVEIFYRDERWRLREILETLLQNFSSEKIKEVMELAWYGEIPANEHGEIFCTTPLGNRYVSNHAERRINPKHAKDIILKEIFEKSEMWRLAQILGFLVIKITPREIKKVLGEISNS